jgi:hypothetical protein
MLGAPPLVVRAASSSIARSRHGVHFMPLHARHYVIVVADTTPLLYLSRIGRLNIVQAL